MTKIWRVLAIMIFALALVGCSQGETDKNEGQASGADSGQSSAVATPSATEDGLAFMDVNGLEKYVAANKGKPTLVVIWTTWCPSCKQQMPEMEKLQASHGDKANIVAISLDESKDALVKFYKDKGQWKMPSFWGDETIASQYAIEAIPTLIIFNKDGNLTFKEAGVYPHSMLGVLVDKLVSE